MDPRPFTLHQLNLMAGSRFNNEWNHTSSILAMLNNTAQGCRKAKSPQQFHPLLAAKSKKLSRKESANLLHGLVGVNVKGSRIRQGRD
jgi:hypothetical protein